MTNLRLHALALAVFLLGSSAFAQTAAPVDGTSTQTPDTASANKLISNNALALPKLKFVWRCGSCRQDEAMLNQLEQAYITAASQDGRLISETNELEVVIYQLRERPTANRILFGAMAGKDAVGVKTVYRGQNINIRDASNDTFKVIELLLESVGSQLYQRLSEASN